MNTPISTKVLRAISGISLRHTRLTSLSRKDVVWSNLDLCSISFQAISKLDLPWSASKLSELHLGACETILLSDVQTGHARARPGIYLEYHGLFHAQSKSIPLHFSTIMIGQAEEMSQRMAGCYLSRVSIDHVKPVGSASVRSSCIHH